MIEDFSKIYDKMLKEQTQKTKNIPLIKEEIHGDKNTKIKSPKEEPLEKFLLNLNEKLKQKIEEKKKIEEKIKESQRLEEQTKQKQLNETEEAVEQLIINDSEKDLDQDEENNLEDVENTNDFENFYIKELEKIDKSSAKKLIKENEDLTNQIQNLQTQITRLNVEAGTWGGGDIGGGGSGSRGGDGSCMCDRLVAGDQSLILNSDGTLSFPNQQISTPTGLISVFGDLNTSGKIYQNGNDLQSEIESISSVSNSVYTTVNTNSSNWVDVYTTFKNVSSTFLTSETDSQTLSFNDLNKNLTISNGNTVSLSSLMPDTSVRALTSNWESTYTTFKNTSSTFLTSETDSQTLSFNDTLKTLSISNGNTISLSSLVDSASIDTSVRALTSNWQSTYTTVSSNSALWDYQGTDIKALTSGWVGGNEAYTNLISNSSAYLSAVDLTFLSVSGNWNSTYTTVLSNSALWVGGGSDVSELSANWQNTYTTVSSNSANWDYISSSLGLYLPLSGGTMTGKLTAGFTRTEAGINIGQGTIPTNSDVGDLWMQQYTLNWKSPVGIHAAALSNGSNFFNKTQVISVTDNDPALRITQTGTGNSIVVEDSTNPDSTSFIINSGGKVGIGVDYLTNLNAKLTVIGDISSTEAIYASGGNSNLWNDAYNISQNLLIKSLDWDSTYTTVSSNSANWGNTYTILQANSATWGQSVSGVAQIMTARVYNADSVTMNKGDVVYTFGATGDVMSVKLASNVGDSTSARTLGFVNGTIDVGGIGYVIIAGQIDKMSFPHPFEDGDALWLGSTAGTFTRVKPTAPNHGVYLGVIERANNGNGLAYVKVQNGYELDEIHDVQITSVSAAQILRRNSSNNLWINTNDGDKWDSVYSSVTANSATWSAITSYSSLIGNSTTNPITATHNLNTKDIVFSVREVTTDKIVYAAARTLDNNNLELTFNTTPSINQYDLTILSRGNSVSNNQGTTNVFSLTTISSNSYIQDSSYTHNLYSDTPSTGTMTVYLLPPAYHIGVTQHKKIGSTANVVLSAPNGALIDGYPLYTLTNQYESIGLYTDGTNYFIQ